MMIQKVCVRIVTQFICVVCAVPLICVTPSPALEHIYVQVQSMLQIVVIYLLINTKSLTISTSLFLIVLGTPMSSSGICMYIINFVSLGKEIAILLLTGHLLCIGL